MTTSQQPKLGYRQIQTLQYLRDNKVATTPEVRESIFEQGAGVRGATRQAYGVLAGLEELGLCKREPIPAKQRLPRSQGGATYRFKLTPEGRKTLKAAEKAMA